MRSALRRHRCCVRVSEDGLLGPIYIRYPVSRVQRLTLESSTGGFGPHPGRSSGNFAHLGANILRVNKRGRSLSSSATVVRKAEALPSRPVALRPNQILNFVLMRYA